MVLSKKNSLAREDIEWKDTSKNPTVQEVVVLVVF